MARTAEGIHTQRISSEAKRTRLGMVIARTMLDIHINKDPLWMPIILNKMGIYTVVLAYKNGLTRGINTKIIEIKEFNEDNEFNLLKQLKYVVKLNKRIREERLNTLLFYNDGFVALLIRILNPKIRIIFRLGIEQQSFDELPYPKALIWLSLLIKSMSSDMLTVYTQNNYDITVALAPFTKKKLRFIEHGIPEEFFENYKAKRENVVLSVARINPTKCQDVLVKAFAKVYSKHKDWQLRLAGQIEDQDYYKKIMELADSLGVRKALYISTESTKEDIMNEYMKASIFCLCSTRESPGVVRGEAMAMGVPVVTTKTGGSELVDGIGVVVPIKDVDALAKSLDYFMSNPEKRDEVGIEGRKRVGELRATKAALRTINSLNNMTSR